MVNSDNESRDSEYVEEAAQRPIIDVIKRVGLAVDAFDTRVIDGFGVMGVARVAGWCSKLLVRFDAWTVDGVVNVGARVVWALSIPVRRIQSGFVQNYVLAFVIGLVGFLGYFFYLARHATH